MNIHVSWEIKIHSHHVIQRTPSNQLLHLMTKYNQNKPFLSIARSFGISRCTKIKRAKYFCTQLFQFKALDKYFIVDSIDAVKKLIAAKPRINAGNLRILFLLDGKCNLEPFLFLM